jgi:shikimate dehydrogenase
MRQFGLIGWPLGHSFSKGYFADKFHAEDIRDCRYDNFPLSSIAEFPDLVSRTENLCGLNVTIPYKEAVIPYLDDLDEEAAAVGAVNTIRFHDSGLRGYNTDIYGFRKSLEPLLSGRVEALILGTGGASKAVAYVLGELGLPYTFVSRRQKGDVLSYDKLSGDQVRTCRLIVNTTPLGMYPDIGSRPDIPYEAITAEHILYDLVYNPEVTVFLREGERRGAIMKNGLEMLQLQADRAWAIWNDF